LGPEGICLRNTEGDLPTALPIRATDYYDFFPDLAHRAGDIWADLPSFGMLGVERVPGLVITPACDLQNNKSDSISFLPIVTVRKAFALRSFFPEVIRAIDGQLQTLQCDALSEIVEKYVPIDSNILDELSAKLDRISTSTGKKVTDAIGRAKAGMTILRLALRSEDEIPKGEDLRTLFGASGFAKMAERIVTNAYRGDLHFLPSDQQDKDWSVIAEPSLVFFRYPFSAPIEIFDRAQDTTRPDWSAEVRKLTRCTQGAQHFAGRRPMKRQTLKPRFLADLLTRYVSMHVRLGAPDFTDDSIRSYVAEISAVSP